MTDLTRRGFLQAALAAVGAAAVPAAVVAATANVVEAAATVGLPAADFEAAMQMILGATGFTPNHAIVGKDAFIALVGGPEKAKRLLDEWGIDLDDPNTCADVGELYGVQTYVQGSEA